MVSENIQQQNGQVSQNHTDENTRSAMKNNAENMTNTNLNNNHHNTVSNNMSILQVPEERSENSQNYFRVDTQPKVNTFHHTSPLQYRSEFRENLQNYFQENTQPNISTPQHTVPSQNRSEISKTSQNYFRGNVQPNVNTPQHAVPSQNRSELSENSRHLLTQVHSMEPQTQRPQKNGGVRRNIMRTRNNNQNWEPQNVRVWETSRRELQDVCMCETSRAYQQNNWWSNNQLDTTSYSQLPPRKFQKQR